MNTAEGVRRLAQVIRGATVVLAGIWVIGVQIAWPYPWTAALPFIFWSSAFGASAYGAAFVCAIGFSAAWVLMGFAGDRSPPRGPGDDLDAAVAAFLAGDRSPPRGPGD